MHLIFYTLILAIPMHCRSNKVLIITHSFNRPDFIEYQAKTFKAFLHDKYEFVVFNDAKDKEISNQIKKICMRFGLECIDIPQGIHGDSTWASIRTSNVIEYSLLRKGFDHHGIVFIIDSDMFLIKPLSIKQFLGDYQLYGEEQRNGEINYLWNGLLFMDMATLPNKTTMSFSPAPIKGKSLDTGGHLYYYLARNPEIRLKTYGDIHIDQLPKEYRALKSLGFDDITCGFIINSDPLDTHCMQFHADNHFLHYRAGGNWMHKDHDYHTRKSAYLFSYLDEILKQ